MELVSYLVKTSPSYQYLPGYLEEIELSFNFHFKS